MKKKCYYSITRTVKRRFDVSKYFLILITLCCSPSLFGMTYDNRWMPLFEYWGVQPEGYRSWYAVDYMMATAHSAIGKRETNIGIQELAGPFDLGQLAAAYDEVYGSATDPLESQFRGLELPFNVAGKFQAQGIVFSAYQELCDWLFIGGSVPFLRINSRQEFKLNKTDVHIGLTPGLETTLDTERRELLAAIGLQNRSAQLGIGDIDFFVRFSYYREYILKCRRVDLGFRPGIIIPSGEKRILNQPTSIPFGGDGHFGWYLQLDGFFELKEDLKAGAMMRVIKRISKETHERLPVQNEPYIYAPLVGSVTINPGPTVVFAPYLMIEGIRKGLGFAGHYTLVHHSKDSWNHTPKQDQPPVTLESVMNESEWGYDYFTIHVFYDFGKVKTPRCFDPIASFRWDIPAMLYITSNVPKTQRVSLGIEWAF